MKMFHIPSPWDYHKYGGYIILAETSEQAVEILKKDLKGFDSGVLYDQVEEVEGLIYSTPGCDD